MFWLIKQLFIVLLSFSGSLTAKCVSLNNEPSWLGLNFIDLNPTKLNYYPFEISLDKFKNMCC